MPLSLALEHLRGALWDEAAQFQVIKDPWTRGFTIGRFQGMAIALHYMGDEYVTLDYSEEC